MRPTGWCKRSEHACPGASSSVNALVRRFDLTESQYNALRILRGAERRGEQLNQAELADRLIASRANTTWILDKLEERKLVRRKGHSDRRKNLLEITQPGQKLLQRIDPEFERLIDEILGQVSDEELDSLQLVIAKFQFN
jgi:DNA-binding MarR family transcriptional regulator